MTRGAPPPTRTQVIDLLPSPDQRIWSAPQLLPTRREELTARLLTSAPACRAAALGTPLAETLAAALYTAGRRVGALARALRGLGDTEPARALARLIRRFVRGELLSGQARTDCDFWRRGRRHSPHVDGHTEAWSYKAGIERAATRWAIVCDLYAIARFLWPAPTLIVAGGLAATTLAWGLCRAAGAPARRRHRRDYLEPLHRTVKDVVRTTVANPHDWLRVPVNFRSNPSSIRIELPAHFGGDPRIEEHVAVLVRSKLGLGSSAVAAFHPQGARPYLTFKRPERPPDYVGLADLLPLLGTTSDHNLIIGLTADRVPSMLDLKSDSPHFLASAGTVGGKSTLMRALLAQGLRAGGRGVILDVKQFSHMWAVGLPNCDYCVTAAEIHDKLLDLLTECHQRSGHVRAHADTDGNTDHIDVGPRTYILCEEMNATTIMLQTYWRKIRQKGDPLASPAVVALQQISFMGRAVKMHELMAAQRASAQATAGGDTRENFDTRALTRYSTNTWRMLAGEIWPPPPKSLHPGRWQIVRANTATETQVLHLSPREARELALASHRHPDAQRGDARVSQAPPPRPQILTPRVELREQPATPTTVAGHVAGFRSASAPHTATTPPTPDAQPCDPRAEPTASQVSADVRPRLIGLRQAIQERIVTGISLTALRKCRERDPDFPETLGTRGPEKLHDVNELAQWARNRKRQERR